MKVLEVIRQGQIGGGETHLLSLVQLIDRQRVEPICLSFTDGEMVSALHHMGITCHVIPSARAFDPSVQRRVIQLMRQERIDIVHAHGTRAASNVLLPARWLRLPLVYSVHGWSFHEGQSPLVFNLRKYSEKVICQLSSRVICVSQNNADTGQQQFGLKPPVVIKNGVNHLVFSPHITPVLERSQFGFQPHDIIVGFIARCTEQKAPLQFLEALCIAHEQNPAVKGLFVGEGDMDQAVDSYIAQHHMQSFLYRSPFRQDVPQLLRLIDIYCLPSLWEGLSIALLEAMSMAKPIIVTPTDGTREVIRNAQNGLIVPFHSPQHIAAAIQRFITQPELATACGANARELVAQHFSAQHTADSVLKVYCEL